MFGLFQKKVRASDFVDIEVDLAKLAPPKIKDIFAAPQFNSSSELTIELPEVGDVYKIGDNIRFVVSRVGLIVFDIIYMTGATQTWSIIEFAALKNQWKLVSRNKRVIVKVEND